MTRGFGLSGSLLLVALAAGPAAAQDPLSAARDLYAAAAYEDALTVLNRLRAQPERLEDRPRIEQYRAFCLLALGRSADAEQAIEALVIVEPWYQPSDAEASPRVRSAFTDVRRRVLPGMVQQRYTAAKQAYDEKQYAAAAEGFGDVLEVLADPDVAPAAMKPPLSDLRTLAAGFRELAVVAAAPPPPPPPPPAPPAPEPVPDPLPAPTRIYTVNDGDVTAPVAIAQALPPFPRVSQTAQVPNGGVLDVVIGEAGTVESATLRSPINPIYDRMVVNATKEWRFKPATVRGMAVKYRKLIQIEIKR